MMGTIAVILVFGGLIFFHELGHFLFARMFGMGVKTFSLGFGPAIFSTKSGNTTYQIAAFPLGGFVSLVGETPDAEIPEPFTVADSFSLRPAWQRFFVIVAGATFNFLLAWLIFWGLIFANGAKEPLPVIGEVLAETPAAAANLRQGDTINSINGRSVSLWTEVTPLIRESNGEPVTLTITRDGERQTLTISPKRITQKTMLGKTVDGWAIGITHSGAFRSVDFSFAQSAVEGVKKIGDMLSLIWESLTALIRRDISADNMAGPIGITQAIYKQSSQGVASLLFFAAFLSVNLGVLNLLPIPVLDGGHLVFITLEMAFRRPVPIKIQEKAAMVGISLLLMLMLFATYNDIGRILKKAIE